MDLVQGGGITHVELLPQAAGLLVATADCRLLFFSQQVRPACWPSGHLLRSMLFSSKDPCPRQGRQMHSELAILPFVLSGCAEQVVAEAHRRPMQGTSALRNRSRSEFSAALSFHNLCCLAACAAPQNHAAR